MDAVILNAHLLLDYPLYTAVKEQHNFSFGQDQGGICIVLSAMLTKCLVLRATFTCAPMPRCLMKTHLAPNPKL